MYACAWRNFRLSCSLQYTKYFFHTPRAILHSTSRLRENSTGSFEFPDKRSTLGERKSARELPRLRKRRRQTIFATRGKHERRAFLATETHFMCDRKMSKAAGGTSTNEYARRLNRGNFLRRVVNKRQRRVPAGSAPIMSLNLRYSQCRY